MLPDFVPLHIASSISSPHLIQCPALSSVLPLVPAVARFAGLGIQSGEAKIKILLHHTGKDTVNSVITDIISLIEVAA